MEKIDVYKHRDILPSFWVEKQMGLERWGQVEGGPGGLAEIFRYDMVENGAVRCFCTEG